MIFLRPHRMFCLSVLIFQRRINKPKGLINLRCLHLLRFANLNLLPLFNFFSNLLLRIPINKLCQRIGYRIYSFYFPEPANSLFWQFLFGLQERVIEHFAKPLLKTFLPNPLLIQCVASGLRQRALHLLIQENIRRHQHRVIKKPGCCSFLCSLLLSLN